MMTLGKRQPGYIKYQKLSSCVYTTSGQHEAFEHENIVKQYMLNYFF